LPKAEKETETGSILKKGTLFELLEDIYTKSNN
jgi:hypothetical protein